MKADKHFDFYEFAGIVMPGAILLVGLGYAVPHLAAFVPSTDMTVGTLGVFLILSYAAGHLIQTIGNIAEFAWWYFPGMPTDWVRTNSGGLLSESQRQSLERQISGKLGLQNAFSFAKVDSGAWFSLTRQVYAAVASANRADRVDTFNGNYGLNRGLGSSLLAVAVVVLIDDYTKWPFAVGLAVAALAALYRMHRFGRHYARELFVQFLQLPVPPDTGPKKTLITE